MSDKKITQLTQVTELTGAELLPLAQGGVTKSASVDQLRGYQVYTALLTQSGGDEESDKNDGDDIYKGVTYYINNNPDDGDFTIYGAPNNNVGTYFVCTQNGIVPHGAQLLYNTGAPVVTVLENTIGNVWFTYDSVGTYYGYSDGLFTENKTLTLVYENSIDVTGGVVQVTFDRINNNQIIIQNGTDATLYDSLIINRPIEIRVYN